MSTPIDVAKAYCEELVKHGVRATYDPRKIVAPCILIAPPAVEMDTNCGGTGEMVINGVAGDNWIWVGPQHFEDPILACPTEYTLTVTCDTVPVDLQSFIVE